tara:strand:- start:1326 stop:1616 length:291 start_codon:yes stop_codon:yes gene_type:complete
MLTCAHCRYRVETRVYRDTVNTCGREPPERPRAVSPDAERPAPSWCLLQPRDPRYVSIGLKMPDGLTHKIDVKEGETIELAGHQIVRVILPPRRGI